MDKYHKYEHTPTLKLNVVSVFFTHTRISAESPVPALTHSYIHPIM